VKEPTAKDRAKASSLENEALYQAWAGKGVRGQVSQSCREMEHAVKMINRDDEEHF
jgi:hypothetical protein